MFEIAVGNQLNDEINWLSYGNEMMWWNAFTFSVDTDFNQPKSTSNFLFLFFWRQRNVAKNVVIILKCLFRENRCNEGRTYFINYRQLVNHLFMVAFRRFN